MRFSIRRSADRPLGRRPARPADDHGHGLAVAAVDGAVGTVDAGEERLAALPALVAELERHGHEARLTDRTDPCDVPDATSHVAYLVFRESVDLLVRRAPSPQRLDLRVRCEDDQLLVSMQSVGVDPASPPLRLTAEDLASLSQRIADAGGRTTVRATQNGNWIAIARLPL